MRFRSIKTRIIILVLISGVPGLIVIGILGIRNRDYVRTQAELELKRVVRLLGHENEMLFAGINQTLFVLSHSPHIMRTTAASRLLTKVRAENSYYTNIFVANADGKIVASALPFVGRHFGDPKLLRDAMSQKSFSVGQFVVGTAPGKPLLHFAYPALDRRGRAVGIVGIAMDLAMFGRLLSVARLPDGSIIALTDHAGRRLYRYPDTAAHVGTKDLNMMMGHMKGPANEGSFLGTGIDGIKRYYAYRIFRRSGEENPFLYMRVGVPVSRLNMTARMEFLTGIVLLPASFFFSIGIAWTFGSLIIGKRLDIMRRATRRFGTGDFSRVEIPPAGDELDELAAVLNMTADRLVERDRESLQAKAALQNSQDTLRSVFNSVSDAIFIHRRDGSIVDVNDRMLEMYGVSRSEAAGMSIIEDYSPPDVSGAYLMDIWNKVLLGGKQHFEWCARRPHDGSLFDVEVFLNRIKMNGDDCILATARDITSRKHMEKTLDKQRLLMQSVINALPAPLFYKDRNGRYLWCNEAHETAFGVSRIDIADKSIYDILPPDIARISADADDIVFGRGMPYTYETVVPYEDGTKHTIVIHKAPFSGNGREVDGLVGVIMDITDLKRSEERLRVSLNEKEVLLKEIHHRVKNNLQIISSLLSLQSVHIHDQKLLDMFRDSQTRVRTMALVHQKLYQSDNFARISFNDYARDLLRDIFRSYGAMAENIHYEIDSDGTSLDIDTMMPIGLILSELVSNSIKHAFPRNPKGVISVSFRKPRSGGIALTVADDGTGFPEGFDMEDTCSLGLQLVVTLMEQLEGRIEIVNDNGARIIMIMRGT